MKLLNTRLFLVCFLIGTSLCSCVSFRPLTDLSGQSAASETQWAERLKVGKRYRLELHDGRIVTIKINNVSDYSVSGMVLKNGTHRSFAYDTIRSIKEPKFNALKTAGLVFGMAGVLTGIAFWSIEQNGISIGLTF